VAPLGHRGLLASLATGVSLVALDRPDTRSWSMLADRILVARQVVDPGEHRVGIRVTGSGLDLRREFEVTLPPGGIAVLVVTDPQ